jgi:hypothetical protein
MKTIFKFTVIALGIAAIALSIVAVVNHCCKNKPICCDDDFNADLDELED